MKTRLTQRARMRDEFQDLLRSLGSTDGDVATRLARAGVRGVPCSSRGSAMARYLNAVVGFDPRITEVSVTSRMVTVTCSRWWLRDVVVPTPASIRSFIVRFDRRDFSDLLASPPDPWHMPGSESSPP